MVHEAFDIRRRPQRRPEECLELAHERMARERGARRTTKRFEPISKRFGKRHERRRRQWNAAPTRRKALSRNDKPR
jgi:hypothetical protein